MDVMFRYKSYLFPKEFVSMREKITYKYRIIYD